LSRVLSNRNEAAVEAESSGPAPRHSRRLQTPLRILAESATVSRSAKVGPRPRRGPATRAHPSCGVCRAVVPKERRRTAARRAPCPGRPS